LTAFGKLQAQVTAAFSAIDSEVSTRVSEVSRVDGRIDTEISDRTSDVQSVRDALATEVSDRQSDVQSVRDVTDNHEGRLNTAESQLAGLGTMSTQNSDAVNITGGTITGVTVNAQSMEVGTGATADLFVGNDGKVGIGTEAPTEKLTVNGNIDMLGGEIKNLSVIRPVDGVLQVAGKISTGGSSISLEEGRVFFDGNRKFSWNFFETPGDDGDDYNIVRVVELNTKQIKLVVSDTAPEHIDGREWLDTTDFRRYISISNAWVESITA
jgi:hypothetical protein